MKEYINKVGNAIPNILIVAQSKEQIKDQNTLFLYGYFQETGLRGFWKKVSQGIKALNLWHK